MGLVGSAYTEHTTNLKPTQEILSFRDTIDVPEVLLGGDAMTWPSVGGSRSPCSLAGHIPLPNYPFI